MTEHDFHPLDPNEGPTVWARQLESNQYTYTIAIGIDPTDPIDAFELSANEIERLSQYVSETQS